MAHALIIALGVQRGQTPELTDTSLDQMTDAWSSS
jgi:hypothetical protein